MRAPLGELDRKNEAEKIEVDNWSNPIVLQNSGEQA